MLERVFLEVLSMSLYASIVIIIVMLIRLFLKNFPKFISYMLWSVVLFRLLCPFKIELPASPIPNVESVFQEYSFTKGEIQVNDLEGSVNMGDDEQTIEVRDGVPALEAYSTQVMNGETILPETKTQTISKLTIGKYIWLGGVMLLIVYSVISTLRIRNKVATAIRFDENIYVADKITSPFVMGLFRPKIYLPLDLSKKESEYVILHEQTHIKHFDHVLKLLGFLAVCIHWFNPFVWVAFVLFGNDMEMCCDETVVNELGESIKPEYSATLLSVSANRRFLKGIPVDFGEGSVKERLLNLKKFKTYSKSVLVVLVTSVIILIFCLASTRKITLANEEKMGNDELGADSYSAQEKQDQPKQPEELVQSKTSETSSVSIAVEELYRHCIGDPGNFYRIDENRVLWGSGRNQCGQLGQSMQDTEFHANMVKIAENVIDIDYSQKGFVIYLTEDHKLYGIGNCGSGALLQYDSFDWTRFVNGDQFCISEPCLLMEGVKYARCGRDDIVCMTEDDAVWTWGCMFSSGGRFSQDTGYLARPTKILDNAALVTGGWFNHAALLKDGTVWTWGYNTSGNCGVADAVIVDKPTMVAEGVTMVWTDLAVNGYPQPKMEDFVNAWTGKQKYDMNRANITEFGLYYPKLLCNTVIKKNDGSYWVCGENVGTEKKMVQGAEGEYPAIWTEKFCPCN